MAETVLSILNAMFMDDAAHFSGPFQREMVVRFGRDPLGVATHVSKTPTYAAFISGKVVEAAGAALVGPELEAVTDSVLKEAIAAACAGEYPDRDFVWTAVRATPEWRDWRLARIEQVAFMCGRKLSRAQVASLMEDGTSSTVNALREVIEAFEDCLDDSDAPEGREPDGAGGLDVLVDCADQDVDDAFVDEFNEWFGRDPTVHDYFRVRELMVSRYSAWDALHAAYVVQYQYMRATHRDYLADPLSEAQFSRLYLPLALTDPEMPQRHRDSVLGSEGYRVNMCARLDFLHKTLFGEELTPEEAEYIFVKDVRAERLELQSDRLNASVMAFAEQTMQLYSTIGKLYQERLGRQPEDDEVKSVLQAFRVDEASATDALQRFLTRSLEYREVLRTAIVAANPGISVPAVFKKLEAVLALPKLASMTAEEAVASL